MTVHHMLHATRRTGTENRWEEFHGTRLPRVVAGNVRESMLQFFCTPPMFAAPCACTFLPQIGASPLHSRPQYAVNLPLLLSRSRLLVARMMESEHHRYVPIDTSNQEAQCVNGKDPCSSGSNGDCGGLSRSDGRHARASGDALMEDTFYLQHVGHVTVTLSDTHLLWRSIEDDSQRLDANALLCCRNTLEDAEGHLLVPEIFAVNPSGLGPVSQAKVLVCSLPPKQLHRIEVHTFLRAGCKWIPKVYVFGHTNEAVVRRWAEKTQLLLYEDPHRPKTLLVFVNPYGGKGSGVQTWKRVASLFELAKIKVTVVKTDRAGHARDVMDSATKDELNALDGVVVVGGDGFFNEVLNGLVLHRHKAQAAIMPQRLNSFYEKRTLLHERNSEVRVMSKDKGGLKHLLGDSNTSLGLASDQYPLLQNGDVTLLSEAAVSQEGKNIGTGIDTNLSEIGPELLRTAVNDTMPHVKGVEVRGQADGDTSGTCSISLRVPVQDEQGNFLLPTIATTEPINGKKRKGDAPESPGTSLSDVELENPNTTLSNSNPNLRIGIIPAGSTDTVVVSTTGARDPLTSALHIILGDSMPLDIVRITAWKKHPEVSPNEKPEVRYAASFAGYGFYGDVMRESEDLRWMGPARYDIAGCMVFLKHKTYEAEISFLDIPQNQSDPQQLIPQRPWTRKKTLNPRHDAKKKVMCLANCAVCASGFDFSHILDSKSDTEGAQQEVGMQAPTWKTCHAKFHSIGAAVMSCRNEKAPEGVAVHAHLADGLLHLILIRECSRPDYLRQLLRLTRRGADPFDFSFVEHHKTPLFTFLSHGDKESMWNVDGELLPARQLTGQVFRGLVTLFARGPEI